MASVLLPAVKALDAVMVLPVPALVIVMVLLDEPVAVIVYPPAGAVCGFPVLSVIVTGEVIVAPFRAVIAEAKSE